MKVLTLAFLFQFVLSCWPKVDIKNNIKTIHKVNHLKIYLLGRHRWSEVGMGRDRRVPN